MSEAFPLGSTPYEVPQFTFLLSFALGVHSPSRAGRKRRFLAKIGHGGKLIYIGSFDTEMQAALAYDQRALELKGDRAILNFNSSRDRFASSLERGNIARRKRESEVKQENHQQHEHDREYLRRSLQQQQQQLSLMPVATNRVLMRVAPSSPQQLFGSPHVAHFSKTATIWI